MKKLVLTIAIVLGIGLVSFADSDPIEKNRKGGLFQRGITAENATGFYSNNRNTPVLPLFPYHDLTDNQDGAPLGTGIAVMLGLGAAYLVGKKRKED